MVIHETASGVYILHLFKYLMSGNTGAGTLLLLELLVRARQ